MNYTFRHLLSEKTAAAWLRATPADFVFTVKASQRITHYDRLHHPADTLPLFFERAALLGDRLGPILFQTPPTLKRDDDTLAGFVASLPPHGRHAIEVRHASWYAREVYELLAARGVALVHADGGAAPSPLDTLGATAPFVYLRLRPDQPYDDAALARWAALVREQVGASRDVYVYMKDDAAGVMAVAAEKLRRLLA